MKRRKKKPPAPLAAVLLSRREWKEWQLAQAELSTLLPLARDLVLQLDQLVGLKRRQQLAGNKAAATRAAQAEHDPNGRQTDPQVVQIGEDAYQPPAAQEVRP